MSQISTLDTCHQKIMEDINVSKLEIDQLQAELDVQEQIIDKFKSIESKSEEITQEYLQALDTRITIKDRINELKKKHNSTDYFTDTGDILFKYYDLIERGQGNLSTDMFIKDKKSIMNYFSKNKPAETNESENITPPENIEKTRGHLLQEYMCLVDDNYCDIAKKAVDDRCFHCNSETFITMAHDGYRYCGDCFTMDHLIVDHDKPSYKDPPKEITYFSYKRINHLNEWLNQIQGKETTDIPDEIYEQILLEIKKQRITNMASLTNERIKSILKHMKVHKYYEHIPHIMYRLNGLPMPNFSPDLEEKLRTMFKQIQTPFLKHSPARRKNFLSYSYVLHKFLQLLEKDEYLNYFPLLKSRDKLASQDTIWKLICKDVGWEYIPSL
jgi:predicted ribosome quality control (RQC) complex YloA/Tae2 family protein